MEQKNQQLVFTSGEYETLANAAAAYLINNFANLSSQDRYTLQRLRVAAFGRLIAESEGFLEDKGIFYTERKEEMIRKIGENPPELNEPTKDLATESLLALPDEPDQAKTLEVPYTQLLRDCFRWSSERITSQAPTIAKVLDAIDPELREQAAHQIDATGMQVTLWAYDLGLRSAESFSADDFLFDN